MTRRAKVKVSSIWAGVLEEDDLGAFRFTYESRYLMKSDATAVSMTLPLRAEPYESKTLFAFFDGLIPEGWLLAVTTRNWKIEPTDRMGLLLVACRDCIGDAEVEPFSEAGIDEGGAP